MNNLHEASKKMDIEQLPAFLERVAALVDVGFNPEEIESIVDKAQQTGSNEKLVREFRVSFGDESVPLRIQVDMDDANTADVYFFTTLEFADAIRHEMMEFFEEQ